MNGHRQTRPTGPVRARTGSRYIGSALSAEDRSVAWLGGQASYWHIATRATAKQRITTIFDLPETDLFQKSRALAQYLPRIAM